VVRRAGAVAHAGPATVGGDAVDAGADGDLEQGVAVEVGGERLAQAAHRSLQAPALQAQLLEPCLELAGHQVELAAERSELVAPVDGHLRGEVAAAQPLRRVEEAGDLCLQGPGDEHGAGEGQHEEPGQHAAGQ
jgi:hypothetical protein